MTLADLALLLALTGLTAVAMMVCVALGSRLMDWVDDRVGDICHCLHRIINRY